MMLKRFDQSADAEPVYSLNKETSAGTIIEQIGDIRFPKSVLLLPPITGGMVSYTIMIETFADLYSIYAAHYPRYLAKQYIKNNEFIKDLASLYASEIIKREWASPPIIVGWSLGATLALDCASQLKAAGYVPSGVIMIDPNPMQTPIKVALPQDKDDRDRYFWEFYLRVRLYPDQISSLLVEQDGFWNLNDEDRLSAISRYDQRFTGPFLKYYRPVDLRWEFEFTKECIISVAEYTPPHYTDNVHIVCCKQFLQSTQYAWPESILPRRSFTILDGSHHSVLLNQGIRPIRQILEAM